MSAQSIDPLSSALPALRPYQQLVTRAVRASVAEGVGRTFSVMVARQGGKNELSAQLELALLLAHADQDLDAVKCAPTFIPQAKVSLRRLWSRLRAYAPPFSSAIEGG